ncbi:uncharacterized protein LOC143249760 isoform X2 [Tachypleus tridentatus]|uniref:uncharacterized protein LOC143249760 isoform X2 n=1 Tax=Tachypleus tridentatus TaxID=6853 RepID=UPI003FD0DC5C
MTSNRMDAATMVSLTRNRNKLMRLAEGIKTRKKANRKKLHDFTCDPAHTNIEHLVFDRTRRSHITSTAISGDQGNTSANAPSSSPANILSSGTYFRDKDVDRKTEGCECVQHTSQRTPKDGATCLKLATESRARRTNCNADTRESGSDAPVSVSSPHGRKEQQSCTTAGSFPRRNRPSTIWYDEDCISKSLPSRAGGLLPDEQHIGGSTLYSSGNHVVLHGESSPCCGSVERCETRAVENIAPQVGTFIINTAQIASVEENNLNTEGASKVNHFSTGSKENSTDISRDTNNLKNNQNNCGGDTELCYSSPTTKKLVKNVNVYSCVQSKACSCNDSHKQPTCTPAFDNEKLSNPEDNCKTVTLNVQLAPSVLEAALLENLKSSCNDKKPEKASPHTLFEERNTDITQMDRHTSEKFNKVGPFEESRKLSSLYNKLSDLTPAGDEKLNKKRTKLQLSTRTESTDGQNKTTNVDYNNETKWIENLSSKITVESPKNQDLTNLEKNRNLTGNNCFKMDSVSSAGKFNNLSDSESPNTDIYSFLSENCVEVKDDDKVVVFSQAVTDSEKSFHSFSCGLSERHDSFRSELPIAIKNPLFLKGEVKNTDVFLKATCKGDNDEENALSTVNKDKDNVSKHELEYLNNYGKRNDCNEMYVDHEGKEEKHLRRDCEDLLQNHMSLNLPLTEGDVFYEVSENADTVVSYNQDKVSQRCIDRSHWKDTRIFNKLDSSNLSVSQTQVDNLGLPSRPKDSNAFKNWAVHHLNQLISPDAEAHDSFSAKLSPHSETVNKRIVGLYSKNKDCETVRHPLCVHDEKITLEFKPIVGSRPLVRNYNSTKKHPLEIDGEVGRSRSVSYSISTPKNYKIAQSSLDVRKRKGSGTYDTAFLHYDVPQSPAANVSQSRELEKQNFLHQRSELETFDINVLQTRKPEKPESVSHSFELCNTSDINVPCSRELEEHGEISDGNDTQTRRLDLRIMGVKNHIGPDVGNLATAKAETSQLASKVEHCSGKKSMSSSRLTKNSLISKSERHLKTYSIPQFEAYSSEDVRQGDDSQQRPWSHLYCDVSNHKNWCNSSCNFASTVMPSDEKAATSLFYRHSSIRTSSPRSPASDSVLQKFRKTFSLRFQKNRKDASVPGLFSTSAEQNDSSDESLSRTNLSEESDRGSLSQDGTTDSFDNAESPRKSPSKSSEMNQCENDGEATVSFRIGSLVLRSSKGKRKSIEKQNRNSLEVSNFFSTDSSRQLAFGVSTDQTEGPTVQFVNKSSLHITSNMEEPSQDSDKLAVLKRSGFKNAQHRWSLEMDQNQLLYPPTKTSVKRQLSTPHPVKSRPVKSRPEINRYKPKSYMRRSFSQPLDLQRTAGAKRTRASSRGLLDREGSCDISTASSDEAFSDNEGTPVLPLSKTENSIKLLYQGTITYAEALWDHVTMDPEELGFQAGEVIEVSDSMDKDWWWGSIGTRSGWFPATFVRLRVNQEDTLEDCMGKLATGSLSADPRSRMSATLLSKEQVRSNVVHEIIGTERDFVKHLQDVVQGYLRQVQRRPDMFSSERICTIFGNIEEIYRFQREFLRKLELCIDHNKPHLSLLGNCFLQHKTDFRIYSDYCNNHPLAVSELQELYNDSRYCQFFEACRLLQQMIDISLDGFLLTPVQRICKYPLQLAELLKYTDFDHPDYVPVKSALVAMREVAQLVNERKRRMECLEQLIEWQQTIDGWEGPDILDSCSVLIHSGDIIRASSGWSREHTIFLFDHLLVYCKKDLLKRQNHVYKGRIDLDSCCIFNLEDGKDAQFGVTVKNAWKIYCASRDKWFLFYSKSPEEKARWLEAFGEERQRVMEDEKQGFTVTERAKKAAWLAVVNKQKAKRPRVKQLKGPRPHPDVAVTELLLDDPMSIKSRTGSLPSNFHPSVMVMMGGRQELPKKKGSGWFHFGSGKKTKK